MCDPDSQQELWKTYQSIAFHAPQTPDAEAFAILTAFNPRSQPLSEKENQSRNAQLENAMTQQGVRYWPMNGGAPDGSWYEPGFAVALEKDEAIALAQQWEQNAIYWVEADTLWLLPVLMSECSPQSLNVRFSSLFNVVTP
ncbi:DUF3293 domain-containing protein [Salinivibrio kushneri]|uniref:DUF3293 domain-containing protein n=1 Tax=Salinivibrio kushneri TaxID=1908198 RepID=A0AA47KLC4_9GAMM|nr:DUF3293 domain-containing protein [Salinivibrio kushneri]WBA09096.1 DUF3293 domain-containing protein [Salinivibrio kushneri]